MRVFNELLKYMEWTARETGNCNNSVTELCIKALLCVWILYVLNLIYFWSIHFV